MQAATTPRSPVLPAGWTFALITAGVAVAAALLAGLAPIAFSIAVVFLFAGPHNWMEIRFFLGRMPARWGRLRPFFLTAIAGTLALTLGFWLLGVLAGRGVLGSAAVAQGSLLWISLLTLWVAGLGHLRLAEKGHDGLWVWVPAGLLVALFWGVPLPWDLLLVYLHPLVAFYFLYREIRRRRPEWLPGFRCCAVLTALLVGMLWLQLAHRPHLPGEDALTLRITAHAGAGALPVSSHFLVAAHTFLELLHYGAWIVAIPLCSLNGRPWELNPVPLARKSPTWKVALGAVLAHGALLVVLLWVLFAANYPQTRDIYFAAAVFHVLAEFPFLLRTL